MASLALETLGCQDGLNQSEEGPPCVAVEGHSNRLREFYSRFGNSDDEDEFWGFFCEDLGLRPYRSVEASRSKATVGTSRFGRRLVVRRPEVSVRKSREEEETRNCEERDDTLKLFSGRKRSLEGLKGGLGDGEEKKIACTVELKEVGIWRDTTDKSESSSSESETLSVSTPSPIPSPPLPRKTKPRQPVKTIVDHSPRDPLPEDNKVTQTRTGRTVKSPQWMKDHFPKPLPVSACLPKPSVSLALKSPGGKSRDSVGVVKGRSVGKGNVELHDVKTGTGKEVDSVCEDEGLCDKKIESTVEIPSLRVVPKLKRSTKPKGKKSLKINHSSPDIPRLPTKKISEKKSPCVESKPRERLRGSRCHRCKGCLRSTDCGKCINCLDKPRFGGFNVRRQCCVYRKCVSLVRDKPLKSTVKKGHVQKKKSVQAAAISSDTEDETPTLITHAIQNDQTENNKIIQLHNENDTEDPKLERRTRPLRKAAINRRFRIVTSESKSGTKKQMLDLISTDNDMPESSELNSIEFGDENQVLTGDMVIGQMVKSQKLERLQRQKKGVGYHSAAVKLPFKQRVSESEAWRHGYCVPMLEPLLYSGPLCYLCGSGGVGELVYCMSCNEPFHPYCCDFSPTDHGQWYCSNCIVCDVCLTMDNLLECDQCHRHYHECCLSRDHPLGTDDDEIWKCSRCVKCVSCGSVKAGQYDGARWHENFTLCEECALLKERGNVCPVCKKCYQDFDFDSKMIQCALCERWIHAVCADVSDDDYNALSLLPDSVAEFECKLCCPVGTTRWKSAISSDSLSGMRKVCVALKSQFGDVPIDFDSIVSKIEMGQYSSSPTMFGHDILKSLESLANSHDTDSDTHKTAVSIQDTFCKIMVKLFPWFSPDNALQLEPVKCQEKESEVDEMFTATPYPSSDHDYSKRSIPNTPPKTPEKHAALAGQRNVTFYDYRRCLFCLENGDSGPMDAGRLLCVALDEWAHINCCLWSAEVFERHDGRLQHLDKAIARGKLLKCDFCGRPGATTGCCDSRCRLSFHFICARHAGCLFLNNKQVFCTSHYLSEREQLSQEKLHVDRRVYVDLTKIRPSKQKLDALSHQTLKLRIGSMLVTAFGKLVDASDTSTTLLPIGFRSTRVFWSTADVTKCCHYTCTVTIQGDTSTEPKPKESGEADMPSEVTQLLSMASQYNNLFSSSPLTPPHVSPMTSRVSVSTSGTRIEKIPSKSRRQLLQGTKSKLSHVTKSNSIVKPNVKAVNLFPQNQNVVSLASLQKALFPQSSNSQILQLMAVPVSPNVYQVVSIIATTPTQNNQATYLPPILPKPAVSDASKDGPGSSPPYSSVVESSTAPTVNQVSVCEASCSSSVTLSLSESERLRHLETQQLEAKKTIEMTQRKFLRHNLEPGLSTSSVTTPSQPSVVSSIANTKSFVVLQQPGVASPSALLPVRTVSGLQMVTSVSTTASQMEKVKEKIPATGCVGVVTPKPTSQTVVSAENSLMSGCVGVVTPKAVVPTENSLMSVCMGVVTPKAVVPTENSLMPGCVGVVATSSVAPRTGSLSVDSLATESTQKALKTKNLHSICQLLPLGSNEFLLSNEAHLTKQTKSMPELDPFPENTLNLGASAVDRKLPVCCGHVTIINSTTTTIGRSLPVSCDHMAISKPTDTLMDVGAAMETSKPGNTLNINTLTTGRLLPVSHDHVTILKSNSQLTDKVTMSSADKTTGMGVAMPMDFSTFVFSKQLTTDNTLPVPGGHVTSASDSEPTNKLVTSSPKETTSMGVAFPAVSSQSTMDKLLSVFHDHSSIVKPLSEIPVERLAPPTNLALAVTSSKEAMGMAMTSSVAATSFPVISSLPTSHSQFQVPPLCQTWRSGMSMPNILRRSLSSHKKGLISTSPVTAQASDKSINSICLSPAPAEKKVDINTKPLDIDINIKPLDIPNINSLVSRPKRRQDHVTDASGNSVVDASVPEDGNVDVVNGGEPSWSVIDSWISASPVKKRRVTSWRGGAKHAQSRDSEFDIPVPPVPRSQQEMDEEDGKGGLNSDRGKLVFVVRSDDGFTVEASSCQEAWDAVVSAVVEKRRDAGLCSISFAGIDGLLMFGLNQEFVVSVLEQLVDSHLCSQYKFKYINPRPLQAFLPIDTEVSESPHGAVRAEVYERRPARDMFSFLNSKHRVPPQVHDYWQDMSDADNQTKRQSQSNQDLPIIMRYRAMQTSSRENVAVFSFDGAKACRVVSGSYEGFRPFSILQKDMSRVRFVLIVRRLCRVVYDRAKAYRAAIRRSQSQFPGLRTQPAKGLIIEEHKVLISTYSLFLSSVTLATSNCTSTKKLIGRVVNFHAVLGQHTAHLTYWSHEFQTALLHLSVRSAIHERGLFSMKDIEAGDMVIEYTGTIIRSILTDSREKFYESKGIGCYMFRIDDDDVIDATMSGNAARFINHSCEPNCFSRIISIDGSKKIVIFASRNIMQGEEMTYDYKFPYEDVKIPCNCGARRCRKYLN